ncbi:MAG: anthranilate synthase component I family protein [Acidobacteriaceae bacterium]|jgi:anthranilate synthase component 1
MAAATPALPSPREFLRLSREHSLVPVYRIVTADLETPVSAFLRIAAEEPEAFLLESVEGGEHVGRYTFIGIKPYKKIVSRGTSITVAEADERRTFEGDIFAELKQALSGHTPARLPGMPPFTAGAVGFFAYDVVRQIERLPSLAVDELGVPDACLMFFDQVLAFDHVKKEIHLIVTADLAREKVAGRTTAAAYAHAVKRLNRLEKRLARSLPKAKKKQAHGKLKLDPRTPRATFLKSVRRAKEYIASGDVFQCVLSQRFDCVPGVDAFDVYRALRIVNPSPYMYFLRFGLEPEPASGAVIPTSGETKEKEPEGASASTAAGTVQPLKSGKKKAKKAKKPKPVPMHIVGSSPELLVRVHDRTVEYRPIAGTRPRSADEVEDRALEADLRADEKEVAEHVMLVDLGRNDVGRVSEYGTVKVKDLMFVERYSHVMHLVSALEGTLRPDLQAVDAFRACFPAGTLSGAPKIRAMEIIEELEPARRGVYGGSILYADFSGNLDSCIAIRTLSMTGEQGHIQAGAGIVADSVPETEFKECENKARAVVRAIERARG